MEFYRIYLIEIKVCFREGSVKTMMRRSQVVTFEISVETYDPYYFSRIVVQKSMRKEITESPIKKGRIRVAEGTVRTLSKA